MKLASFTKQPVDFKDYDIDYSRWLAPMGDRIAYFDCAVRDGPDDALIVDAGGFSDQMVKVWVGGGTHASMYKVEITVTTAGGRVDQCELIFKIKEV